MAEVTPITLLIGLPGAGKTTLLHHLLRQPAQADTAVVAAPPDRPVWWNAGCPCCAPRDDVARALRAMLPRVRRDEVRRVAIETTDLADPGPILATLLSDTVAASAYRLDAIVTVVDTVNGVAALDAREMAVRQVAVADRIVLSKTDLADPPELRARLRRLNPGAPIIAARLGVVDPAAVLGAGLFGPAGNAPDMRAWLDAEVFAAVNPAEAPHAPTGRDARIQAFCLTFDRPLPWPRVAACLERLILTHGESLLRMKGILRLQAQDRPVTIHSVGHLLHPPTPLAAWPDRDPRNSRLMFITRDLPRDVVEDGLRAFNAAAAA
ncbi:MAG TPA: GTP-binding protein [Acetobacteraceae bacterium]|nr:GTP-binding protein [Acetobacteraceae bacterium]